MAEFAYDIGQEVTVDGAVFEVVSRSENDSTDELQYTIISKSHADDRRAVEAEAERLANPEISDTAAEPAATAQPEQPPQTFMPR